VETFYFILFGVGLGYTLVSFLLGGLLDIGDIDVGSFFPFFKPAIITIFVTVFGGAGLTLYGNVPTMVTLPLAALIGAAAAYAFFRLILFPLSKMEQQNSALEIHTLVGHTAKVTEKIPQGK